MVFYTYLFMVRKKFTIHLNFKYYLETIKVNPKMCVTNEHLDVDEKVVAQESLVQRRQDVLLLLKEVAGILTRHQHDTLQGNEM